jgi:RecA/RadA recombinase
MATKKAATKKASTSKGFSIDRSMSVEQRAANFASRKKELSKDWRIMQNDEVDTLVPTGFLSLDYGLKLYGIAGKGTVYHIHGDEGSGKSTIAAASCVSYMGQTKEPAVYFDFEHRLKNFYLKAMGADMDMLLVDRPVCYEQAVQRAIDFMAQGVRLFVFDSIPRMRSKVNYDDIKSGKAFQQQPGTHSRDIQTFYNTILPYIQEADGTMIMVNQTRSRIEMTQEAQSAAKGYATVTNLNYTLPGGKSNRFYTSVMMENKLVRAYKPGKYEDPFVFEAEARHGEEYLALEIRHRTLKNTVTGTGYRQSSSFIRPGKGLDENASLRRYARAFKLIFNSGSNYIVGESKDNPIKVYPGKDAAIKDLVLDENPEVLTALRELVLQKFEDNDATFALEVSEDVARHLSGEEEAPDDLHNPAFAVEDISAVDLDS